MGEEKGKCESGLSRRLPAKRVKKGQSQTFIFSSIDIWTSKDIEGYVNQTAI
jgi:hypothetical protein